MLIRLDSFNLIEAGLFTIFGLSLMAMHSPPHPGAFIQTVYLAPYEISCRALTLTLSFAASTLNRVLNEASGISPEMALRLSKALGRSPESWLTMQDNYDLWRAKQTLDLKKVSKIEFRYV
jgi:antitoxin HigA-1